MDNSSNKVITIAAMITVAVGTLNSFLKNNRPPSSRFLIGSGVAYFLLSAVNEFEPEIAKGLAIGVMTTVLLSGEAGGVLTYINTGEMDTKKPDPKKANVRARQSATVVHHTNTRRGEYRTDRLTAIPGIPRR